MENAENHLPITVREDMKRGCFDARGYTVPSGNNGPVLCRYCTLFLLPRFSRQLFKPPRLSLISLPICRI